MNEQRCIAAVIQDHVWAAAVGPFKYFMRIIPIILQALALLGENWNTGRRNRCSRVILRRINIAGRPAHIRAKRLQGLNQDGRLNGHVQRTRHTGALQGLRGTIFRARRHQARHFRFSNGDFFSTPIGQTEIGNSIIIEMGGHFTSAFL